MTKKKHTRGRHPNSVKALHHNAMRGRIKNAMGAVVEVIDAETSTPLAKAEAELALQALRRCYRGLEERL